MNFLEHHSKYLVLRFSGVFCVNNATENCRKICTGFKKSANITIQMPICILIMKGHFSTLNSGGCVLLIFFQFNTFNNRAGSK